MCCLCVWNLVGTKSLGLRLGAYNVINAYNRLACHGTYNQIIWPCKAIIMMICITIMCWLSKIYYILKWMKLHTADHVWFWYNYYVDCMTWHESDILYANTGTPSHFAYIHMQFDSIITFWCCKGKHACTVLWKFTGFKSKCHTHASQMSCFISLRLRETMTTNSRCHSNNITHWVVHASNV